MLAHETYCKAAHARAHSLVSSAVCLLTLHKCQAVLIAGTGGCILVVLLQPRFSCNASNLCILLCLLTSKEPRRQLHRLSGWRGKNDAA